MTTKDTAVIVDLASDSTDTCLTQLADAVKSEIAVLELLQKEKILNLRESRQDPAQTKEKVLDKEQNIDQLQARTNGHHRESPSRIVVVALAKRDGSSPDPIPSTAAVSTHIPNVSKVFTSDSLVALLFHAKTYLDETPGAGCDVHLHTSSVMKKFWEAVCIHLFGPVTAWAVHGHKIVDQAVTVSPPTEAASKVEGLIRGFLKTVGNPALLKILRSKTIPEDQFNAGYHERWGGVSQLAPMASMNMVYTSRKTDPILVIEENMRRLAQAAGFDEHRTFTTKAEHGRNIWVVGTPEPPRYDGITTNQPGVTICAAGADCCMILLADTRTGAVGAVHAGWRGTAVRAVVSLLHTMMQQFGTAPADVRAAIGPSISSLRYDMDPGDAKPITDLDSSLTFPSEANPGLVHVELVRANVIMLQREGVPEDGIDTTHAVCNCDNTQFFSHRRDGVPFGNQVGFISRRPVVHALL